MWNRPVWPEQISDTCVVVLGAHGVRKGSGGVSEPFFRLSRLILATLEQCQHQPDDCASKGGITPVNQRELEGSSAIAVVDHDPRADEKQSNT